MECTRPAMDGCQTRMKVKTDAAARHPAAASAKTPPKAAPTNEPAVRPQRASVSARERNQAEVKANVKPSTAKPATVKAMFWPERSRMRP